MPRVDDTDAYPEWRRAILAIPEDERCPTQRELLRAIELVDELIDIFACGKPFPDPASLAAKQSILMVVESISYYFRGQSIYSIIPSTLANDIIGGEGAVKLCFEMSVAHMMNMPTDSEGLVHAFVQRLQTSIYCIKPRDQLDKNSEWQVMAMGLQMMEGMFSDMVPPSEADAILKKNGSLLTSAKLMNMSKHVKALFLMTNDLGERAEPATKSACDEYFKIMESGPACWYTMSRYRSITILCEEITGISSPPWMDRVIKILKRYLEFAKKDGDPFRTAWCSYDLAYWLLRQGSALYREIESYKDHGDEYAAKCKRWLPTFLRKVAFMEMETFVLPALDEFRKVYSHLDYRNRVVQISFPKGVRAYRRLVENVVKRCAACGTQSTSMSMCTGCRKVSYCNRVCQRNHWKDHKKDCKKAAEVK